MPGIPKGASGDGAGGESTGSQREEFHRAAAEFTDYQKQARRSLQTLGGHQESPRARFLVRRGFQWPSSVPESAEASGTAAGQIDGQSGLQAVTDALADATSEITTHRICHGALAQESQKWLAAAVLRVRFRTDLLSLAGIRLSSSFSLKNRKSLLCKSS